MTSGIGHAVNASASHCARWKFGRIALVAGSKDAKRVDLLLEVEDGRPSTKAKAKHEDEYTHKGRDGEGNWPALANCLRGLLGSLVSGLFLQDTGILAICKQMTTKSKAEHKVCGSHCAACDMYVQQQY